MTPAQEKRLIQERQRKRFLASRAVTRHYSSQLVSIAQQVDMLVRGYTPDGKLSDHSELERLLENYSILIEPWAQSVSSRMIARAGRKNEDAFRQLGRDIGRSLQREIATAPTGLIMRDLLAENVGLITSLPLEAAQRIHKLTTEAITTGTRADYIASQILKSGEVTASRARTIARTEISRTYASLTEARAVHAGSEGYIWHTVEDDDVRYKPPEQDVEGSHRLLNNKFIRWSEPPVADKSGIRAHAGCIFNCRCWLEPVF